jgi:hypothetical protein
MRYIVFLIIFLVETLAVTPAVAQTGTPPSEPRYRVELIVLMHLEHGEEARRMRWLEDYSVALDLLTPIPEEVEAEGPDSGSVALPAAGTAAGGEPAGGADATAAGGNAADAGDPALAENAEDDPLGGVVHLPELGAQMQDAWRRLRLSGPFRPLQYLAWEQRAAEPFPTLRVHDEEAVLVQDPWAEQRSAEALAAQEAAATGEPAVPNIGDGPAGMAPDPATDELPPPIHYYRLDGTAQLIRSRFLHLALNVEWREPVFDAASPDARPARPPLGAPAAVDAAAPPLPDAFDVYRLEQSRQVRLRRMEYFDGPVLGVLAWITPVTESAGDGADTVNEVEMAWLE